MIQVSLGSSLVRCTQAVRLRKLARNSEHNDNNPGYKGRSISATGRRQAPELLLDLEVSCKLWLQLSLACCSQHSSPASPLRWYVYVTKNMREEFMSDVLMRASSQAMQRMQSGFLETFQAMRMGSELTSVVLITRSPTHLPTRGIFL